MVRKNKRGLSSAVYDGLLAVKGDIIGFMDADLSHPPAALPGIYKWINEGEAELVIGSRLVKGGGMGVWPWYRRLTSWGARMLARPLTPIKDITSGLFFFKKEVLPKENLNLEGFKIGLEIAVKGHYKKVKEFPIVFNDRQHGESKLSSSVMKEYLKQLGQLYVAKFFTK
jgi:dolichol-phosphate mannosyltransferase